MGLGQILIILGVVCFVLDSLGVQIRIGLFSMGWALIVSGVLLA